jgi:hypothetical protein
MKLELTTLDPLTLLDMDTYDAVLGGRMTKDLIEMNMDIFKGCEILMLDNIAFAISTDGQERKFLNPFRVRVGTKNYRYAFLCYTPETQKLHWFFKGISKTQDRAEALKIYDALADYCSKLEEPHIPLMIKK